MTTHFSGITSNGRKRWQTLAEIGKAWQPFGGAGYFVLLALLGVAIFLEGFLIMLPVAVVRLRSSPGDTGGSSTRVHAPVTLAYFGLIGMAYLLVEIPLIQRFILYLGQPAYAMTAVLFSLLLFSGFGSALSGRISQSGSPGEFYAACSSAFPGFYLPSFEWDTGSTFSHAAWDSHPRTGAAGLLHGSPLPGRHTVDRQQKRPKEQWMRPAYPMGVGCERDGFGRGGCAGGFVGTDLWLWASPASGSRLDYLGKLDHGNGNGTSAPC